VAVVDAMGAAGSRAIAAGAELLDRAALLSEPTSFQRYGIGSPMLNDCSRATGPPAVRVFVDVPRRSLASRQVDEERHDSDRGDHDPTNEDRGQHVGSHAGVTGKGASPSAVPREGIRKRAPLGVLLELLDDVSLAVAPSRHAGSVGRRRAAACANVSLKLRRYGGLPAALATVASFGDPEQCPGYCLVVPVRPRSRTPSAPRAE
jgi:hypothetical protein